MKILLITAYFYPENTVAVLRVGQWASYWAEQGHDVTVLTTKKYHTNTNSKNSPPGIRIVEIPYLPKFLKQKPITQHDNNKSNKHKSVIQTLKNKTRIIRSKMGYLLDIYNFWINPAVAKGNILFQKESFDLILSSYSPAAAHIIANKLKKKQPEVIWFADFRDPWTENHVLDTKGIFRLLSSWKEKKTLLHADGITIASSKWFSSFQKKVKQAPIWTIENGFDPNEFPDWKEKLQSSQKATFEKIVITYTGTIYPKNQDPSNLLDAINELIEEEHITSEEIQVNFYGHNTHILEETLSPSYRKFVKIHGLVLRKDALHAQQNSDLLLLLEWDDPEKGILMGKTFEYLVSGKPILVVGRNTLGSTSQLIKNSGTGLSCTTKIQSKNFLKRIRQNGPAWFYKPDINFIEKYNREYQAKKIIDFAEELRKTNV